MPSQKKQKGRNLQIYGIKLPDMRCLTRRNFRSPASNENPGLVFFKLRFCLAGGAINSARSFVTSWLSELTQSTLEQNDEETRDKTQLDEESVTTNSEESTSEL